MGGEGDEAQFLNLTAPVNVKAKFSLGLFTAHACAISDPDTNIVYLTGGKAKSDLM